MKRLKPTAVIALLFVLAVFSVSVASAASMDIRNGVFAGPTPWVANKDGFYKNKASAIQSGSLVSRSDFLPEEISSWPPYLEGGMVYSVTVINGLQADDIVCKSFEQSWTDDYVSGSYTPFFGGFFCILINDYTHNGGSNTINDWLHHVVNNGDGTYTLVTGQGVYFLVSGPEEQAELVGYGFKTTETLLVYRGATLHSPQVSSRGYTFSNIGVAGGTQLQRKDFTNYQNIVSELPRPLLAAVKHWGPGDGRLNPHPGAPVAVYPSPYQIYGIDPVTGNGAFALELTDEEIEVVGIPLDAPVLIAEGTNPYTGQPIMVFRLPSGEFQLNTYYPDGKPYIVKWKEGESFMTPLEW